MSNKEEQEPVVSKIEGDEEEDSPYQFQDNVLSCLFELQLLTDIAKEKISLIEDRINNLRLSIHGEDVNKY
jgi:hypothetical protein